jgi:hypothetical protein
MAIAVRHQQVLQASFGRKKIAVLGLYGYFWESVID